MSLTTYKCNECGTSRSSFEQMFAHKSSCKGVPADSMSLTEQIEELRREKKQLSGRIFNIDQEIYQLQRQCPHNPESLDIKEAQVLERWYYDTAYSYDATGKRVIEKRHITCSDCGTSWVEMRFTDAEWLESNEWEKRARKELRA